MDGGCTSIWLKEPLPFAQKKLSDEWEEKEIYAGEYRVIEIRSKNVVGEAIEFHGNVIHLTLWKAN